jgi:hypothetical protein
LAKTSPCSSQGFPEYVEHGKLKGCLKKTAHPSKKGGISSLDVPDKLRVVRRDLLMASMEYRHSRHPVGVVKKTRAQDLENSVPEDAEVVLQCCGWYVLCGSDVYVQLGFENVLNSLAQAADRQISRGGWAASESD